jgi:hypothetical protein
MPDLKKRVISGILGLTLAFTLVACDSGEPPSTTRAGDSVTTEPVGS